MSRKHVVFAAVAVRAFSRGGFALPSRRFKALADEEEPPDVRQLADIIFSAVTVPPPTLPEVLLVLRIRNKEPHRMRNCCFEVRPSALV